MSQIEINAYIAQLTAMQLKVLAIAEKQLETSFSLTKSIGFIEWQKKQQKIVAHNLQIKPLIGKL